MNKTMHVLSVLNNSLSISGVICGDYLTVTDVSCGALWTHCPQKQLTNQWKLSKLTSCYHIYFRVVKQTVVVLTHWGRVTHTCVHNLTITGPDNGLSRGQRQAVIWTNAGMLLIGPLGTSFSEILIEIHTFSFKEIHLKMSPGKWRPFCLGLYVLRKT